jgi:hypothetical protein
MKKKLKWKKKIIDDCSFWIAEGPVGWEFSVELDDNNKLYDVFVYFGSGDDIPLSHHLNGFKSLNEAKKHCQTWLFNLIIELNKWL